MLYKLYPDDILKREEAKNKLTMEDLNIEVHLRNYDEYTKEQVNSQLPKK